MLVWNGVSVLVKEALDLVLDIDGVVGHGEGVAAKARLFEDGLVLGSVELLVKLLNEGRVGAGREARLLVEQREDAELALDNVDAGLIICVVDKGPADLLPNVLLLLELEDVGVKLDQESEEGHNVRS